jgi:NAD(P)-dependent dehydrogenase (short-subunit alcohol dehydrogenase family)
MSRELRDKVVVITGASSGIGLAAARLFARHGATVVLAARSDRSLEEAARACEQCGVQALAVPTDVADEGQVCELARRAIERFGRIDIWVNNAAVLMFARTEDAPYDVYRQVIETNLFGYIHGARAVLPYFRRQGHGVLINNASLGGVVAFPWASAYVTSKFGVMGFSQCLRQELMDVPNIRVCTVLPASIDTPIYQKTANYTGSAIQPITPIYSADKAARAIVALARRPQDQRVVGGVGHLLLLGNKLAPGATERVMGVKASREQLQPRPAPPTEGNVFEPLPQWNQKSGGWKLRARRSRAFKLATAALTLTMPAAALLLLRR